MALNEKIFYHRKRMGLSQEELAEKIGVSRQAVSKWELGTSVPELDSLVLLAKTFGVTTDSLLTEAPETEEAAPVPPEAPHQSANEHTWLDRLMALAKHVIQRFGWLVGVYIACGGVGFAGLGFLAKSIVKSMFIYDPFESLYGGSLADMGFDPIFDSYNQAVANMASNNPVTILASFMIGLGVVLIIGGVILAIYLKKKLAK